jgi:putative DNA primase/helicase
MANHWSFEDVEYLLTLPAQLRAAFFCVKKLTVTHNYSIAADFLLHQNFAPHQLGAVKELIRVKLKVPKSEQAEILATLAADPAPEVPDPVQKPSAENPLEEKLRCGKFVTWHENSKGEVIYRQKNHSEIAALLAEELQGRIAYDHQRDEWPLFNGYVWRPGKPGSDSEAISAIFERESWPGGYSDGSYKGSINVLKNRNRLKMPEEKQGIIPFRNGILEISSGKLLPLTPETAQRWCLPYEYSVTAGCPEFKKWLKSLFRKHKNADDIVNVIRCFINACITRKSHLQIFLHLQGLPGSGKSTLARVIEHLFSDEAVVNTSLKTLEEDKFEKTKLEGADKCLLVLSETTRFNKSSHYQLLKSITGRDSFSAGDKYDKVRKATKFTFKGGTIMTSNPGFSWPADDAGALARRARIIEFLQAIPAAQQAEFLAAGGEEKLYAEAAGIVNWALELEDKVVNNTLINPPEVITLAVRRAEFAGSPLSGFIFSRIVQAPGVNTLLGGGQTKMEHGKILFEKVEDEETMLMPAYLRYCAVTRQDPRLDLNTFSINFVETANRLFGVEHIKKVRIGQGTVIKGVRLATENDMKTRANMLKDGGDYEE